ncbi:MAG: PIN domain-containing protein [bacterium]
MSDAKVFVDSNILIYAHDGDAGVKYTRAGQCLQTLWSEGTGCLSMQVLQEFFVNATQKLRVPLPRSRAREVIRRYGEWDPIRPDIEMMLRATDLAERRKLSFWDALIVVAALESGATTLYSEDFSSGHTIEGLKVVNPLVG